MGYKGKMASHMRFVVLGRSGNMRTVRLDRLCQDISTYAGHEDFVRLIKEMPWKDY